MRPARLSLLFVMLATAVACSLLSPLAPSRQTPDPINTIAQTVQSQLTHAVAPTVAPTAAPTIMAACGFEWASEPEKDVTAKMQSDLDAAGFSGIQIWAEAFGEDCVRSDGVVDHFSAMQTDFKFTVPIQDLMDYEAMGTLAGRLIEFLQPYPLNDFPGAQKGNLEFRFVSGEQDFWAGGLRADAERALAEGMRGAALLKRLRREG